jgi:hypothetical protein
MPSYATLTDLKTHAGIPADGADALLQALLDSASQWIDGYTNSVFSTVAVAAENYDGRGAPSILLRLRPVLSIDSVALDGGALDAEQYALVDGAWLVAAAQCGFCPRLGYLEDTGEGAGATGGACATAVWPRGTQNVSVDYTGGYTAVPAAVAQACALLAAHWFREDQRGGAAAESYGPRSVTYRDAGDAPLPVRALLAQFVQPELGY